MFQDEEANPLAFISANAPDFFMDFLKKNGYNILVRKVKSLSEFPEVHRVSLLLVRSNLKIDRNFIDKAASLKIICRPGAGLDNIDVTYAQEKGITVLNSPGANKDAVAEHALGMLLSMLHHIPKAFEEVKDGKWRREANRGDELGGKTVGIIGFGNTGSAFARKLSAMNVAILAYDKYKHNFGNKYVRETRNLTPIFEEADVLSLHIPLHKETYRMVNSVFLKKFKKRILLINTSRGDIVDLKDLVKALESNKLRGAALDVLPNEDLASYTQSEQEVVSKLLKNKVIITPHIAGWSVQSEQNHFECLMKKIKQF